MKLQLYKLGNLVKLKPKLLVVLVFFRLNIFLIYINFKR